MGLMNFGSTLTSSTGVGAAPTNTGQIQTTGNQFGASGGKGGGLPSAQISVPQNAQNPYVAPGRQQPYRPFGGDVFGYNMNRLSRQMDPSATLPSTTPTPAPTAAPAPAPSSTGGKGGSIPEPLIEAGVNAYGGKGGQQQPQFDPNMGMYGEYGMYGPYGPYAMMMQQQQQKQPDMYADKFASLESQLDNLLKQANTPAPTIAPTPAPTLAPTLAPTPTPAPTPFPPTINAAGHATDEYVLSGNQAAQYLNTGGAGIDLASLTPRAQSIIAAVQRANAPTPTPAPTLAPTPTPAPTISAEQQAAQYLNTGGAGIDLASLTPRAQAIIAAVQRANAPAPTPAAGSYGGDMPSYGYDYDPYMKKGGVVKKSKPKAAIKHKGMTPKLKKMLEGK